MRVRSKQRGECFQNDRNDQVDRGDDQQDTPISTPRTPTVASEPGFVLDIELHRGPRSWMCHQNQGRERANSVEDIMTVLTKQPVSVVIRADTVIFQLCSGGVLQVWCGRKLDHEVFTEVVRVKRMTVVSEVSACGTTESVASGARQRAYQAAVIESK